MRVRVFVVSLSATSGVPPQQVKMSMDRIHVTKTSTRVLYLLIVLVVVLLDRWTKSIVAQRIRLYSHIQIIPGFFRLTHTENTGAAFSGVALVVVSLLLWKNHHAQVSTGVGLSLIMGGALGNLWDRLVRGRVVDFLLFYYKRYEWPVFNLADSAIVIGAGLLVLEILFHKGTAQEESKAN
jgi:signal peptidase II